MPRLPLGLAVLTIAAPVTAADPPSFERDVRAVLKAYCLDCHGGSEKPAGKLDLRLKRFAIAGGTSGPAVVPGDAAKSLLVERMKSEEMPPAGKKVPAAQIAVVERWIAAGAPTLRDEPTSLPPGLGISDEERAYWFYQPLTRPTPPTGPTDRVRTPIDAFVLAKLRERGFGFNPDADRATLIRRAAFDLTGLPPTAAEVAAFVSDPAPDAYEKLLGRLLASPAYGERWGRHWLDTVGYADSEGDGPADTPRPHAWRYRDYVIRSLNTDKPLDRFVTEQLAGDELVPRPWTDLKPEHAEVLAATGFLRTVPDGGLDAAQQVVADALQVIGSALLGTSVGCARCHDHRYDPVPQEDYFRLRAVFEPAFDPAAWRRPGERLVRLTSTADQAKAAAVDAEAAKLQSELDTARTAAVKAAFENELAKFPAADRDKLRSAFATEAGKRTPEQARLVATNPKLNITPGVLYQYDETTDKKLKAMDAAIKAKRATRPAETHVAVTTEVPGKVPATKLFHRGDPKQPKGPDLAPGDLTVLASPGRRFDLPAKDANSPTTGRRLAFARHLTDGTHPLFGRVMANRLWLHHFGRGIVDTPGEFGKLGQPPTHPELLDWLATELPRQGWSLKKLHKLLMTSTVYRQSSRRDPARDAADAANALYGRYPVRRLEAEAIRDRMLTTAGRLDRTPFGPPVPVAEDAVGLIDAPDDKPRRSVYLQQRRTKPVGLLVAFDAPAGELSCDRRQATTNAPQALALMNGDFTLKQASHVAARVRAGAAHPPAALAVAGAAAVPPAPRLAATAWELAYQRAPDPDELRLAATFLRDRTAARRGGSADPELAALTDLCQQLLASNEFLYVD